jgi:hypothetical protein
VELPKCVISKYCVYLRRTFLSHLKKNRKYTDDKVFEVEEKENNKRNWKGCKSDEIKYM